VRRIALALVALIALIAASCGDPYDGEENATPPPANQPDGGSSCALDCGTHGHCEATACKCDAEYAGATCRDCAPGLSANPDGTCRGAPCGTTVCKAHEICEALQCKCGAGYETGKDVCIWRGGPLDPSFQDMPAGAWLVEGNGVLVPKAMETGFVDPGSMHLSDSAIVSQSFDMPTVDVGEPLAIDLSSGCPRCGGGLAGRRPELIFTIAPKKGFVHAMNLGLLGGGAKMTNERVCLGEAAFDGRKTIVIRGREIPAAPIAEGGAWVDRLAILPDPTCPRPGVVTNGDFDGTGGWTGNGANAEVANAVGTNGTRGARLHAKCGEAPAIAGWVSVPLSSTTMKHPALSFTWKLTSAEVGGVALGPGAAAFLRGTGAFEQAKICLPEWTKGTAQRLQFYAREAAQCTPLSTSAENVMLVDDVKLVDEPTCPDVPMLFDPGFEQGTPTTNRWALAWNVGASASITKNGQARSGENHLQMLISQCGSSASVAQTGTVPDAAAGAGPAAKFWYRATIQQDSAASGIGVALPSAAAWTQRVVCLPPMKSGLSTRLDFTLNASAQTTCATGSTLMIDDVELTTDPSCPAQ
jgi:hypothetical protein